MPVLLLALQILGQEVDALRADDPARRDAAERRLLAAPLADVQGALAVERDPEARARLLRVRGRLLLRESEDLYRAGRTVDSLKKRLEAAGLDPEEYGPRSKAVAEEVRKLTAPSFGCEQACLQVHELLKVVGRRGRWTYLPLLEALGRSWSESLALDVLARLGPDAHPVLREALHAAPDPERESGLLAVLRLQRAWEELRAIEGDAGFRDSVRRRARKLLEAEP